MFLATRTHGRKRKFGPDTIILRIRAMLQLREGSHRLRGQRVQARERGPGGASDAAMGHGGEAKSGIPREGGLRGAESGEGERGEVQG